MTAHKYKVENKCTFFLVANIRKPTDLLHLLEIEVWPLDMCVSCVFGAFSGRHLVVEELGWGAHGAALVQQRPPLGLDRLQGRGRPELNGGCPGGQQMDLRIITK